MMVLLTLFSSSTAFNWKNYSSNILDSTLLKNIAPVIDVNLKENQFHNILNLYSNNNNQQLFPNEDKESSESRRLRNMRRMGRKRVSDKDDSESSTSTSTSSSTSESSSNTDTSVSSSSASSSEGNCPPGKPQLPQGDLKVVSDITKESKVQLITDSHLAQRFKSPPKVYRNTTHLQFFYAQLYNKTPMKF